MSSFQVVKISPQLQVGYNSCQEHQLHILHTQRKDVNLFMKNQVHEQHHVCIYVAVDVHHFAPRWVNGSVSRRFSVLVTTTFPAFIAVECPNFFLTSNLLPLVIGYFSPLLLLEEKFALLASKLKGCFFQCLKLLTPSVSRRTVKGLEGEKSIQH